MIPDGFFQPGEDIPTGDDILEVQTDRIDGYRVVYLRGAESWDVYSPDVPGVYAGGASREEAEATMREAIPFHLAASAASSAR